MDVRFALPRIHLFLSKIDLKGKANGRGAYLKKDKEIILAAQKSKVLDKKLEVEVPQSIYEELLGYL